MKCTFIQGKAFYIDRLDKNGTYEIYDYGTLVLIVDVFKKELTRKWDSNSNTTSRHVNMFLQELGLKKIVYSELPFDKPVSYAN